MSNYRIIVILFAIFFVSSGYAATIGNLYHVTFNWKIAQKTSAYYEMTSYIFNSMSKEPAYLYSKYGNLSGVYIWVPNSKAHARLERVISTANNPNIDPVIDLNLTLKTLLDKIFIAIDQGKIKPACKIHRIMEFSDADKVMKYLTKIQYHIFRRAYPIVMTFMGKTRKKFDIIFEFYADCDSKKAIVNDLLDVISHDDKAQRQLY